MNRSIIPLVLALFGPNQGLSMSQHQSFSLFLRSPAASMVLDSVTEKETSRVMRDFPCKKVWRLCVKLCLENTLKPLVHLVNLSFSLRNFFLLSQHRQSHIPIFKKRNNLFVKNYQPIFYSLCIAERYDEISPIVLIVMMTKSKAL